MLKRTKLIIIINIFIFLLNASFLVVYADDEDEEEDINSVELQEIVETVASPTDEPNINAKAAIIYDRTTKKVLWEKNKDERRAMASTTKIMTAIVVLENSALYDVVTISKKAANTGGSRLKINTGDQITVSDLLYGLMLRSRKRRCCSISRACWWKHRKLCRHDE